MSEATSLENAGLNRTCASGQVSVAEIDAMTHRCWRMAWVSSVSIAVLGTAMYFMVHVASTTAPGRVVKRVTAKADAVILPETNTTNRFTMAAPAPTAPAAIREAAWSPGQAPNGLSDLSLVIAPRGACWVSAIADGQRVVYRLMDAGDRTQIQAHEEVVLTIGDPASCGFAINGAATRPFGTAGKPVTVHLTPENFHQFLDR